MKKTTRIFAAACLAGAVAATPALADHSWANYHWNTGGTNTVAIPVVDNTTTADWRARVSKAVDDWNGSPNINSGYSVGDGSINTRRCTLTQDTIQVCNEAYGFTGWIGIASISVKQGHIVAGNTKLNDSYFNSSTYNTDDWRQAVTCQEIGHDYGLGHQNEDFNTDDTNSCMEYTRNPAGNTTPDAHDFQELATIYGHTHADVPDDGGSKPGRGNGRNKSLGFGTGNTQAEWGRAVATDAAGRANVFVQTINGYQVITHVTWVPDAVRAIHAGGDHHH